MSTPSTQPPDDIASGSLRPGDALPPVEPPSAGFIVQLFVIPAVIVLIIVAVWLMFNWLAHLGSDPKSYIDALQRDNAARWQAAVNLANALRDPRYTSMKQDAETARRLAQILDEEITKGRIGERDKESLELRSYLASALGEFQVPDVLPVLLRTASTERGEYEAAVRFAGLRAVAVYLEEDANAAARKESGVAEVLLEASKHDKPLLRSTAAFGLGAIGSEQADERLRQLLVDADADVRYNSASMLARRGDLASLPVLLEMLDPDSEVGLASETTAGARELKQSEILIAALRAGATLAKRSMGGDLSALRSAVERLRTANVPKPVQLLAADVSDGLAKPEQK